MKLFRFLCFVALLSGSALFTTTQAQIDVTINPLNALFGTYTVGVDFALQENISVEPTISITSSSEGDADYTGIPINVFGKYYFNPDKGADKFYADVWLRFVSRKYEYNDSSSSFFSNYTQTRFGVGFGIGWKIVADSGLTFDIGFGAGRAIVDNTKYDDSNLETVEVDWPELMFAGKLGIGYRFGK